MRAYVDAALPLLRLVGPETAHTLTIRALERGWGPTPAALPDPRLATEVLGMRFPSPVGLAAGFDKNAEVPDRLLAVGFGFVEVGTLTPEPQPGAQRPRVFRLSRDRAVINRLGFNSRGLSAGARRLAARAPGGGIVGANVGPNRDSADAAADFARCVETLAPLVRFLVLNLSSPNTPGLRDLQTGASVAAVLDGALTARERSGAQPPVLVKIAPDLDDGELAAVVETTVQAGGGGLVVGNTTVSRPSNLRGRHRHQQGGLSGRPLFARSTRVLAKVNRFAAGRLVLVAAGGVSSGADAYAKICAGAHLVELYTALVYEGPGLVSRIHTELAELLARDGFDAVGDAVGAGGQA